ncbi:lipase family alpha/beta hydrolase [Providencia sp.]|uniref:lipase family alpha/beta hydrolase n=1 Tax=Providencia sp. TaxID=589 RepID=UPI003F9D0A9D
MSEKDSPEIDECQHVSYHLPTWNKEGRCSWVDLQLQHKSLNAQAKCIVPPTKVIPVIFIPGIMGTNLKDKNNKPVWRADKFMGVDTLYLATSTGERRRQLLNVESTFVDNKGKYIQSDNSSFVNNKKDNTSFSDDGYMLPKRKERGWGEALFLSYGTFLDVLQSALLDDWQQDMFNIKRRDKTKSLQYKGDKSTGVLRQLVNNSIGGTNEALLTEDELNHFEHFLFSVHVYGYNWLEDNAISAANLTKYIDNVLETYKYQHGYGLAIEKVIILTHSMGGLIARYAMNPPEGTFQGCQDKVLGVVHGVIPDLGSPAAYRRMKVGAAQEGMAGKVLGATAKELMSVLAFAPAPLQLLPYPKYKCSWLTIESAGSYPATVDVTTGKFDPFNDIYLRKDVWWRLYEPDILDKNPSDINNNWKQYFNLMKDNIKIFMEHQEKRQYHPNTYVFYGTEVKSDNTLTWSTEKVVPLKVRPKRPLVFNPENNQRIVYSGGNETNNALGLWDGSSYQYTQFRLVSSQGAGDGTVPVESLVDIINSASVKSSLATNVDHQNAYAVDSLGDIRNRNAIRFTLRAIVKMVQEVDIRAAD